MADPIVSWRVESDPVGSPGVTEQIMSWNVGTVDAGEDPSDVFTVQVWNNYAGEEALGDVRDMQRTTINALDENGAFTGPLVEDNWVEFKEKSSVGDFEPIGADIETEVYDTPVEGLPFSAVGSTTNDDDTFTPGVAPHDADYTTILGVWNDGSMANAKGNYAELLLRVVVPGEAPAGTINFLLRVRYAY